MNNEMLRGKGNGGGGGLKHHKIFKDNIVIMTTARQTYTDYAGPEIRVDLYVALRT